MIREIEDAANALQRIATALEELVELLRKRDEPRGTAAPHESERG